MEDTKVNEHLIKVSGKCPIKEALSLGEDIVLTVKGSVVQTQDWDNQDGTKDKVYVVKPTTIEIQE